MPNWTIPWSDLQEEATPHWRRSTRDGRVWIRRLGRLLIILALCIFLGGAFLLPVAEGAQFRNAGSFRAGLAWETQEQQPSAPAGGQQKPPDYTWARSKSHLYHASS
jgi:hypothetical protein